MNKTYNQREKILVDRHTVLGNYSVIFQVLAFQKVINKCRQIHSNYSVIFQVLAFQKVINKRR